MVKQRSSKSYSWVRFLLPLMYFQKMRLIKYKIKKNNIFFKKFKINYILFKNNFKKLNTNNKKTNIFFSYFNKKNTFNIDIDNNNVKILIYFFYFNKIYLFN